MVPKDPTHWQDPVWSTTDAQPPGQQQVAASYLMSGTKFKTCLMPVLKSSADVQHSNNELCFQGQCQEFGFHMYGKDQIPQQVILELLKIALKR